MTANLPVDREELLAVARAVADRAHAPYSRFPVGAALAFADGRIVTGANVENASYGLSLCAETVAVAAALAGGIRGGLRAIAIAAPAAERPVAPCGRCRQVLYELAALDGADPMVWSDGADEIPLSALLPHAFGPADLGTR